MLPRDACILSKIHVNVEEIVDGLNLWQDGRALCTTSSHLCVVRYDGLQICFYDTEKSDCMCCVTRVSYASNIRIFSVCLSDRNFKSQDSQREADQNCALRTFSKLVATLGLKYLSRRSFLYKCSTWQQILHHDFSYIFWNYFMFWMTVLYLFTFNSPSHSK
jgi:hypothetical protein